MNETVKRLIGQFKFNDSMVQSALKNIDPEKAQEQLSENTHSFQNYAVHITERRYFLAGNLGSKTKSPYKEAFSKEKVDLTELVTNFQTISKEVYELLENITDEQLAAESSFPTPGDDKSVLSFIAILSLHESYHLGQLGLLYKAITGKRLMDPEK